jgi:hypothetical protein
MNLMFGVSLSVGFNTRFEFAHKGERRRRLLKIKNAFPHVSHPLILLLDLSTSTPIGHL